MALVIDKAILEILKINENTPLEISTDGTSLNISPMTEEQREAKLKGSLDKINKKYGKALKNMA